MLKGSEPARVSVTEDLTVGFLHALETMLVTHGLEFILKYKWLSGALSSERTGQWW